MICDCPYCGHSLERWLENGVSSCLKCNRPFDSCDYNSLLSAAWSARKRHVNYVEELSYLRLSENVFDMLQTYVLDDCLSHDELIKKLNDLHISRLVV